ncbi:protein of unknown function [Petrocella atlantisensis]|uniref:Uncharacterized protein n=1 Tax=Petrocella atlantisensis TaxID=2173034 RepID=A0A3P7S0S0_9FIRM|nr:protein of unknown function [Petrocella atlantisensis]
MLALTLVSKKYIVKIVKYHLVMLALTFQQKNIELITCVLTSNCIHIMLPLTTVSKIITYMYLIVNRFLNIFIHNA